MERARARSSGRRWGWWSRPAARPQPQAARRCCPSDPTTCWSASGWATSFEAPVLGLFGGADEGINAEVRGTFETALTTAGVDHKLVVYPNAPHSFFDRKADEYSTTSAKAWVEVLAFIRSAAPIPA